jgi:hypothetical protein
MNYSDKLRYIELGADPDFQREFANALYIPHRYANLFPA